MDGHSSLRAVVSALAAGALLGAVACGSTTTASGSSTSHNSNSSPHSSGGSNGNTSGNGQLDPQVSMPSGFPSDFPIYSGARPTQEGSINSNGKTTWAVTWQTLDSGDKVNNFYIAQLGQGDWTVSFSGSSSGTYSIVFTRKSDTSYGGAMAIDTTKKNGVTEISVVLAQ